MYTHCTVGTTADDHPDNATMPVKRPLFHSTELVPMILNALKTRKRD